jgi:CheY-like chemotaxis protein
MNFTCLIADDHPFVRRTLTQIVGDISGSTVVEAQNGGQALNLALDAPHPDIILLDVEMPELNGFEVCQQLKNNPKTRSIPVIFVTGKHSEEDVKRGLELGAHYYLTKPVEPSTLRAIIGSALENVRNAQQIHDNVDDIFSSLNLLTSSTFEFKTLEQARTLSTLLAKLCPDPDMNGLGLMELMINAVEHGNLAISYDDKSALNMNGEWEQEVLRRQEMEEYKNRIARVSFQRTAEAIIIDIEDEGTGFNYGPYLDFDPARAFDSHGRGIAMANQTSFDDLQYLGSGNHVRVRIQIN